MIYEYLNTIIQKCKTFIQQDGIKVIIAIFLFKAGYVILLSFMWGQFQKTI